MSRDVVAVAPEDSLQTILGALERTGISGVPVVSKEGQVLGVVSEGDLILKVEYSDPERAGYWRALISSSQHHAAKELAAQLDKAVAVVARDLMSSPAITVHADASVTEAAHLMRTEHVKRLPVVDEGDRLVGIVSRVDLVQSLSGDHGDGA